MKASTALTVVHVDAERGFSGGEVQVFLLMEGLRRAGHRNVLIAPQASRALEAAQTRGFETRALDLRSDLDVTAVVWLARELRRIAPDLVHLHTGRATWLGGLAARLARVPALTTRRMDRRVRRGWRTRFVYGTLVRAVVAISPAVARCLTDGGVDPGRIVLVPSAIDPERVRPARGRAALRAEFAVPDGARVVLTLSALVERKGLDVLLEALALLARRDVRPDVWIAGDGPERARLAARSADLGLGARVRLLGARADPGDLLAGADVFVLPARAEGLGVAALEAMAAGRAVVASRVGGLAEAVVDGRTGILVPPDDAPSLAAAIERVLADDALRARLGAAGPTRVSEGFLPEQMVDAYERVYARVLGRAPAETAADAGASGPGVKA